VVTLGNSFAVIGFPQQRSVGHFGSGTVFLMIFTSAPHDRQT